MTLPPPPAQEPHPGGYDIRPAGYAPLPPAPSGTPWMLGLIALVPIPFLSALVSGVVMAVVGRQHRRRGGTDAVNGRHAANWGLTYSLLTLLLVGGHAVLLFTLTRDAPVSGFFPLGIFITMWFLISVAHLVASVAGALRAGRGQVFRFPAIPFYRD